MCHEYTVDNPGRAVTKFQFSSLFNKAWFLAIQPSTIVSGFRKVGVYPFDPAAIKPYEISKAPTVKTPIRESRIESGHGPSGMRYIEKISISRYFVNIVIVSISIPL